MKNGGKMTAKRFRYILFDGFEDYGEYISPNEVVNLLNALHEENQQLKGALKELKEIDDYQAMRIQELNDIKKLMEEENEQLKKQTDGMAFILRQNGFKIGER